MIKIEIKSAEVKTKSGVSAKTGKNYSIREQEGYAFTFNREGKPNAYPERIVLSLRDEDQPYQPGFYTICPSSFYVAGFGVLSMRPALTPLDSKQLKSA